MRCRATTIVVEFLSWKFKSNDFEEKCAKTLERVIWAQRAIQCAKWRKNFIKWHETVNKNEVRVSVPIIRMMVAVAITKQKKKKEELEEQYKILDKERASWVKRKDEIIQYTIY